MTQSSNLLNYPETAVLYNGLGIFYQRKGIYEDAESYLRQALDVLKYPGTDTKLDQVMNPHQVVETLRNLGLLFLERYNEDSGEIAQLELAVEYFGEALRVVQYRLSRVSPSSELLLRSTYYQRLMSSYLEAAYLIHQATDTRESEEECFVIGEKLKALDLLNAFREAEALHIAGVPDSLLAKEHDLRIDIAYYEKMRNEKETTNPGEKRTIDPEAATRLSDLRLAYSNLKARIEQQYPDYYRAKYGHETVGIKELQQQILLPEQALLQYAVGDSSIFISVIKRDTFSITQVKRDFPLREWIEDLTGNGIHGFYSAPANQRSPHRETETIANYTTAALDLYQKLVEPVKNLLPERIIIVPDGELSYIPFEALLMKAPPRNGVFRTYSYLLEDHQISYAYSAALLKEMQEKQHYRDAGNNLLGMAPFFMNDPKPIFAKIDTADLFSQRQSHGPLNATGEEVASVRKMMGGTAWFGEEATLDQFNNHCEDHRILHLSTHGKADDRVGDYAYLALRSSKESDAYDQLFARDLYNYQLNADMVVLSACETGTGMMQRGEGIISLARAFAYAGAKSIFTTLWQVNDEKTKDLVVDFYRHLKRGKDKDVALWRAKKDFLERYRKDNNNDAQHPYFWAGLIGIGDMEALE